MRKGYENTVTDNPKSQWLTTNMYFLLAGLWVGRSSAGLSWALLGSPGLLILCSKMKSQPLSVASYARGQKLKDKTNSKYFLKPPLKTGHHPFHLYGFGQGKPLAKLKVKGAERRVYSVH